MADHNTSKTVAEKFSSPEQDHVSLLHKALHTAHQGENRGQFKTTALELKRLSALTAKNI